MTTTRELANELEAKVSDVKRLLREGFGKDTDFSSPDRALTAEQVQRVRDQLPTLVARRRRPDVDVAVEATDLLLPAPNDQLPFAATLPVAASPRAGLGHRLLLHQDVLGFLQDRHGELRRLQAAIQRLMREMLVEGRAHRVKGTRGVNNGWLRAPLGDNGGNHYYLWHALAGMRSVPGLGLERGDVVLRLVRHHDDTGELLDAGVRADYIVLDARAYVEEVEAAADAADFLSQPQRDACEHSASLSIGKGHPGAGKTTLQLERTRRYHGRIRLLTFGEAQRGQARRWLETYAHDGQDAQAWTHLELFSALDPEWQPAPTLAVASAELTTALAAEPRAIGPWLGHIGALYGELRAHFWGRALPFAFRGTAAALDDDGAVRAYRARRTATLGPAATEGAIGAARLLSAEVRARLFGDLDRASALARALLADDAELPPALSDLDAVLIDEVQDLTLIELLVCALVARRPAASSGRRPAFHVAGDEGQTVRATDFDWGELKNLINDLLGRPEEFDLPGNVRSPRPITRVINNSWSLYKTLAKRQRPRGYAAANVEETAVGSVLVVDLRDRGLDALCAVVAATAGAALIYPDTQVPDDVLLAARRANVVHVVAAPEAKGLDFRVAFVLDIGRRAHALYQVTPTADDTPIVELENRTAVDAIRVAISRATEVLVLVERPLGKDEQQRLDQLCADQGVPIDGVVTGVELDDLAAKLDVDTADRHALVTEALADFDRTFADDPDVGLRIAERARGWLGDSNRAGAVQGELRKQVYRIVGLALLRAGLDREVDRGARLSRANLELRNAREPELAALALDVRNALAGEDQARAAVANLVKHARGPAGVGPRYATDALERVLNLARDRAAGHTGKEWDRLLDVLEVVSELATAGSTLAGLRAELALRACEWALEQRAAKSITDLAVRGLNLLAAPAAELRARVAERLEQWEDAIGCYREAARPADALRLSRERSSDVARSLALARETLDPGARALEHLARVHHDLAALSADDLTDFERAALSQILKERFPSKRR